MESGPPSRVQIGALRVFVTLLAALALAIDLHVDQLTLAAPRATAIPLWAWAVFGLSTVIAPLAAVLALALVWRVRPRADSRALALLMIDMAVLRACDRWPLMTDSWPQPLHELGHAMSIIAWLLLLPALVYFTLVFPARLDAGQIAVHGGTRGLLWLRARLTRGWTLLASSAVIGVIFTGMGAVISVLHVRGIVAFGADRIIQPLLALITFVTLAVGVENLRASFRHADADARRRAYWVVEGFLLGTVILGVASVVKLAMMLEGTRTAINWYTIAILASWALLIVCIAIAMFFSGAMDGALAIRRTAVLGIVGIVMVFVFTAVENVVGEHVEHWLGLSDRIGAMLTGGTVALTFEPIRERVSRVVERLVHRFGRTSHAAPAPQPIEPVIARAS